MPGDTAEVLVQKAAQFHPEAESLARLVFLTEGPDALACALEERTLFYPMWFRWLAESGFFQRSEPVVQELYKTLTGQHTEGYFLDLLDFLDFAGFRFTVLRFELPWGPSLEPLCVLWNVERV